MHTSIPITESIALGAKGRNGWFRPINLAVWNATAVQVNEPTDQIVIDVNSSRGNPLTVYLGRTDAFALAVALIKASGIDTSPKKVPDAT